MRKILLTLSLVAILVGCDQNEQKKSEEATNAMQDKMASQSDQKENQNNNTNSTADNQRVTTPEKPASATVITPNNNEDNNKANEQEVPVITEETVTAETIDPDKVTKPSAPKVQHKSAEKANDQDEGYNDVIVVEK